MPAEEEDPVIVLKLAGTAHLKEGRLKEARDSYSKALALDKDRKHVEAHIILANRALTQLKLSDPAECKADCTAALALNPRYGKALFRRAQAAEQLGSLADAFQDVRELMRLEPANKEAQTLAGKLKRSIEARAGASDLSTPTEAVETLRTCAAGSDKQVQAAGKLSKIAEDSSRAKELLHSGAVGELLKLLPASHAFSTARDLPMPLVGLALEALDRMTLGGDPAVLAAIGGGRGETAGMSTWESIGEGLEE
jgi:tetratricopeptide (TPR) repeat protein